MICQHPTPSGRWPRRRVRDQDRSVAHTGPAPEPTRASSRKTRRALPLTLAHIVNKRCHKLSRRVTSDTLTRTLNRRGAESQRFRVRSRLAKRIGIYCCESERIDRHINFCHNSRYSCNGELPSLAGVLGGAVTGRLTTMKI